MFILYLNERHHDFTFFKLAFNTGLDPMATRIRASCVTYSKFLCSSVPIHPSRYPSFCNILSLSRSHRPPQNQKADIRNNAHWLFLGGGI